MRPLIVGEAPSMRTARPFAGRSGERLAELAGVELAELRRRFRLVNLLNTWPGPSASGKGSAFRLGADAKARAGRLNPLPPGSLLCGRRVAQAFGRAGSPFFEWEGGAAVIPHPSGVSRWWNDPGNVAQARVFLRSLLVSLDIEASR